MRQHKHLRYIEKIPYIRYIVIVRNELRRIFEELNERIAAENLEREDSGAPKISPVEIQVLGQMTLRKFLRSSLCASETIGSRISAGEQSRKGAEEE
jgi:hypothetical protein